MVIELDKIADSIEALKHPDETKRELNWRVWRQVQRRRVSVAMRSDMIAGEFSWADANYYQSKVCAIETLYEERHGVSGAWPVGVK